MTVRHEVVRTPFLAAIVLALALGSRGDVEPLALLAGALAAAGTPATVVAASEYEALVRSHGAGFAGIGFVMADMVTIGGGACVDDRVLRRMVPEARAAIRHAGGLYKHALAWSLRALAPRCKAVFGFCGDALAERADLAVGFSRTAHPNLLVYFTRELEGAERERLVAEAHAVGPF